MRAFFCLAGWSPTVRDLIGRAIDLLLPRMPQGQGSAFRVAGRLPIPGLCLDRIGRGGSGSQADAVVILELGSALHLWQCHGRSGAILVVSQIRCIEALHELGGIRKTGLSRSAAHDAAAARRVFVTWF